MEIKRYAFIDYEANVHFFSEFEELLDAAMQYLEGRVSSGYEPNFIVSHTHKKIRNFITLYSVIDNYFLGYELYDLLYLYMETKKL